MSPAGFGVAGDRVQAIRSTAIDSYWLVAGTFGTGVYSWLSYLSNDVRLFVKVAKAAEDNGTSVTLAGFECGHFIPASAYVGARALTGRTSSGVAVVDFAAGTAATQAFTLAAGSIPHYSASTDRIYWTEWATSHSGATWAIQLRHARPDFTDVTVVDGTVTGLTGSSTHTTELQSTWAGTHMNSWHSCSTFDAEVIWSSSAKVSQFTTSSGSFSTGYPGCNAADSSTGYFINISAGIGALKYFTNPSLGISAGVGSWGTDVGLTYYHLHSAGSVIGFLRNNTGEKELHFGDSSAPYDAVIFDPHSSGAAVTSAYTLTDAVLSI